MSCHLRSARPLAVTLGGTEAVDAVTSLFEKIRGAVAGERYLVSWHADEQLEERQISDWQVIAGLETGQLVEARPHTRPNPSVVVRQLLADGTEVEVVWAYLGRTRRAKLVTVYFLDEP